MYIRSNSHQNSKKIVVPDDYSGTTFAEKSPNTYEVENIENITDDTTMKSIPVVDEPSVPASKSIFSKLLPKGSNSKGLGNLFCDDNLILIGLIVFFLLGCNEVDTELLIILALLLFL